MMIDLPNFDGPVRTIFTIEGQGEHRSEHHRHKPHVPEGRTTPFAATTSNTWVGFVLDSPYSAMEKIIEHLDGAATAEPTWPPSRGSAPRTRHAGDALVMRLQFDRGTILLMDPLQDLNLTEAPGVLWDARVRGRRAPASK